MAYRRTSPDRVDEAADQGTSSPHQRETPRPARRSALEVAVWVVITLLVVLAAAFVTAPAPPPHAASPMAQSIMLSSGAAMPLLGLGTWRAGAGEVGAAVLLAARLGYRHVDCADRYGNQREVGNALRRLPADVRAQVFVTTKLWNSDHEPARVRPAALRMLRDLRLTKVDLLLLHWPLSCDRTCAANGTNTYDCDGRPNGVPLADTWRAMEALVDEGLVVSIGVSNFGPKRLAALIDDPQTRIPPAVNQVELHPYLPQHELVALARDRGVALTAYCPIGSPGNAATRAAQHAASSSFLASASPSAALPFLVAHPQVKAIAAKLNRTPAQVLRACQHSVAMVLLRWNLGRGVAVVPKSTSPAHIAENAGVFGWDLPSTDAQSLDRLLLLYGGHGGANGAKTPASVRYVPLNPALLLHRGDAAGFWD